MELELRLGGHADLVGELAELVAAHPLRERLPGDGRPGRAVAVLDELGHPNADAVRAKLGSGVRGPKRFR